MNRIAAGAEFATSASTLARAPHVIAVAECEVGAHAKVGGHSHEVIPVSCIDLVISLMCANRTPGRPLSELGGPKRKAVVRERPVKA